MKDEAPDRRCRDALGMFKLYMESQPPSVYYRAGWSIEDYNYEQIDVQTLRRI